MIAEEVCGAGRVAFWMKRTCRQGRARIVRSWLIQRMASEVCLEYDWLRAWNGFSGSASFIGIAFANLSTQKQEKPEV